MSEFCLIYVCIFDNKCDTPIYIFQLLAFIRGLQIKSNLQKWNEFQLFNFNFKASSYFKVKFSFHVKINPLCPVLPSYMTNHH